MGALTHTKNIKKMLNLYLYLPSTGVQPPGAPKGLIFGNVLRYWKQNTYKSDFIHIVTLFLQRLINRGYTLEDLEPLFIEASKHIHTKNTQPSPVVTTMQTSNDNGSNTLYLHTEYHPRDLSRFIIRQLYEKHLKDVCGFEKFLICYSRPKNLRDSLIYTRLKDIDGSRASDILKTIL